MPPPVDRGPSASAPLLEVTARMIHGHHPLRRTVAPPIAVTLLVSLITLSSASRLPADSVQLRSGIQLHGTILRHDETEVTIRLEGGAVTSFDARLVSEVIRTRGGELRPLDLDDDRGGSAPTDGDAAPRPRSRSTRRPVVGGTLLLPADAAPGVLIEPVSSGGHPTTTPRPGTRPIPPRWSAVFVLDRGLTAIRIGSAVALPEDEAQARWIRDTLLPRRGSFAPPLDQRRIGGRMTWASERLRGSPGSEVRLLTGWVRTGPRTAAVIEVELPETLFRQDPYRYRVIPRSFQPVSGEETGRDGGSPGTSPTAKHTQPSSPEGFPHQANQAGTESLVLHLD